MCHRVLVMYAGRVVEEASVATLFRAPAHPYTRGLIECLPRLDGNGRLGAIGGMMPGLRALPSGCRFHPRCPIAEPRCGAEVPALRALAPGRARRLSSRGGARDRVPAPARGRGPRQALPGPRQPAGRALAGRLPARRPRGGRRELHDRARRDARAGGRVGLRQDHDRPAGPARHRARPRGRIVFEGQDITALSAGRLLPFRTQGPDRLPGPLQLAQPADDGGPHGGRAHPRAPDRGGCRGRGAGARAPRHGGALARVRSTATRTSSPAASASGWASRGPSRRARGSWSPTRRSRRSTSRCAPRS